MDVDVEFSKRWIGYSDSKQEGTWLDLSNRKLSYSNWANGEPNNKGGGGAANCAVIYPDGKWDDQNCGRRHAAVCKKREYNAQSMCLSST